MSEATYEKNEQLSGIVKRLCDERADLFEKIEPSMIECVFRTDKSAPASNKNILKIKGIRGVNTFVTDKRYIIHGYKSQWDILTESKKVAHAAFVLKQIDIPTDEEERELSEKGKDWEWGKLVKPDFVTFKSFVKTYGIEWEEEQELPNVLEDSGIRI